MNSPAKRCRVSVTMKLCGRSGQSIRVRNCLFRDEAIRQLGYSFRGILSIFAFNEHGESETNVPNICSGRLLRCR